MGAKVQGRSRDPGAVGGDLGREEAVTPGQEKSGEGTAQQVQNRTGPGKVALLSWAQQTWFSGQGQHFLQDPQRLYRLELSVAKCQQLKSQSHC